MNEAGFQFDDVTLLVTHYNRSQSLERLLKTFQDQGCRFGDIVVSDDGSKPEHQPILDALSKQYNFRLIRTPVNKGLGNNINKGQQAVKTPLTVYIQEDFVPHADFGQRFSEALELMHENQTLDMVRFYAYFKYPLMKPYKYGFSEMKFSPMPWYGGYRKFYFYSDHPHLRRSNFLEKFGLYTEGVKGDVTEYRMMMSVIQHKAKGLFYNDYNGLLSQENSTSEPTTMKRNFWRENSGFLVTGMRHLYRHARFNFDYHFSKY